VGQIGWPSGAGQERPIRIITFSTLYPNSVQPNHGIFVENRLRHLVSSGQVVSRVVAPVGWVPFDSAVFGRYAANARVPITESRFDLPILHPRVLIIPKVGMLPAPALLFGAALRTLRRLQAEKDFDLIDAHYFYPDGVAATMLGRTLGKPVVITARGTDINLIPRYLLPRRMIQSAMRRAAHLIAVSQALKDALLSLGAAPEAVTVLRNGVDLQAFHPGGRADARRHLKLSGPTLISVGHLIARKGHDLVIAAMAMLPQHSLLIIGEGTERPALEAQIARLGLGERVWLIGAVSHERLREYYVAADALVLASSREGWPNVLLEAMACGTPAIASNVWGNPEVVAVPEAGRLIAERTAAGVAEAVQQLFARPPNRADTRRHAERHSWDETSAGQIRIFDRILSKTCPL
jgi:teichuronic acid biosynthesis glycosyltransferase TuaC